MNCKPGDLAYITGMRHTPEANGMVVRVLRLAKSGDRLEDGSYIISLTGGPTWLVSGNNIPSRCLSGELTYLKIRAAADSCLRPIRDQPGEDETLSWAPAPVTRVAPCANKAKESV